MAVSTIDALYNGTSEKLTTSATGIDVTGETSAGSRLVLQDKSTGVEVNSSIRHHTNNYAYMFGGTNGLIFANNTGEDCRIKLQDSNEIEFITSSTNRMVIDSSGAVTMPSQPAFSVTKSTKQSNVATNSQVTVVFDSEVFDQNNDFAGSQFTAPVTGKYQLNLSLYTNELDSAADYYIAAIQTSNRQYQNVIDPGAFAGDAVYWNQGVSVLADMDANDTAYVFIQQGNGNQQADVATPSFFSGYLVA